MAEALGAHDGSRSHGEAREYAERAEAITIDQSVKADATAIRARALADLAEGARRYGRPVRCADADGHHEDPG